MRWYVIIKIKVLYPKSGSDRKVKQNDNLYPVQDSGSLAVFKVTARDQGHYKGPWGAFVTYCNISCFNKTYWHIWDINVWNFKETLTNDVVSFEQLGPGVLKNILKCLVTPSCFPVKKGNNFLSQGNVGKRKTKELLSLKVNPLISNAWGHLSLVFLIDFETKWHT